jgi:hypothetical protein
MSFLRTGCNPGKIRHAHLPERTTTERAVERMIDRPVAKARDSEAWEALIARVDLASPGSLRSRDAKRLLRDMWVEEGCEGLERELLDDGVKRDRTSIDRAIVESYLLRFPTSHPAFGDLRGASEWVARRRDWPWRVRGEDFRLWDEQVGPQRLATELLSTDRPADVLRRAGLDGDLATGAFVRDAVRSACAVAVAHKGAVAIESGNRLIALTSTIKGAEGVDAVLALALLAPWVGTAPPADHQQKVTTLLTGRIGDPRLAPAKWSALVADLQREGIGVAAETVFAVLRRWLVQATVREFFAIVAKTTDRRDQWKDRTAFWMGYLDAGYITDAWFAFGSQAEREARRFMRDEGTGFGRIQGTGANPNQSSLLMTIGDVRVAEWSDNSMCRFWRVGRAKTPPMYQSVYYAAVLKTMDAEKGYDPMRHDGKNFYWQHRFAKRIYSRTGIEHPDHGQGW